MRPKQPPLVGEGKKGKEEESYRRSLKIMLAWKAIPLRYIFIIFFERFATKLYHDVWTSARSILYSKFLLYLLLRKEKHAYLFVKRISHLLYIINRLIEKL